MEFVSHTLPNQLQIVSELNSHAHTTALGFFVRTGARDETAELAGVSHFLEHMMFKGTPSRSADDVNREFDEMGAHYNAFTSEESTVYYANVLPELQLEALALLADILRPSLRTEDFETEKQVIVEEILMYDDQPPFGADDRCRAAHFRGHPLSHSVLGTVESVRGLSVEAMRDYFRRRYSPGNITLVATGKVDFGRLCEETERRCGHWELFPAERSLTRAKPLTGFECQKRDQATQTYAVQLAAGPSSEDDDRYAAKLLSTILGDDTGSRLYWDLVVPGLVENASLGHWEFQGSGAYITYMSCGPDEASDNLRQLQDIYRHAENEGVTLQEMQQAKNKTAARVVLGSERPRGRLFQVGGNWLQRQEYRSVADDLNTVESLTLDDLHAVLKKYPLTQNTTVVIGPEEVTPPKNG